MDDVTAMALQLSDDQELLHGLLHTLQSRHAAGLVFTRLGSMLIALNPLRSLPQFCSREERVRHLRALDRELPPHIFELGAAKPEPAPAARSPTHPLYTCPAAASP